MSNQPLEQLELFQDGRHDKHAGHCFNLDDVFYDCAVIMHLESDTAKAILQRAWMHDDCIADAIIENKHRPMCKNTQAIIKGVINELSLRNEQSDAEMIIALNALLDRAILTVYLDALQSLWMAMHGQNRWPAGKHQPK